jgi:anti-sigma factor RsiW
MSHLGQRLSALVDSELSDLERDRVLAHLVRCDACRGEAIALRTLKRRINALGETMADTALTGRLMAMAAAAERGSWGSGRRPGHRYPSTRYVAAGIFICVVGLGTTAFVVGGAGPPSGPKVTPAVDMYLTQHAIVTGSLPVAPPTTVAPAPASPVLASPAP